MRHFFAAPPVATLSSRVAASPRLAILVALSGTLDCAAPGLPRTLLEAVAALRDSACFRQAFGNPFIDYFVALKEFEIGRFLSDVTDWEQREYFELL